MQKVPRKDFLLHRTPFGCVSALCEGCADGWPGGISDGLTLLWRGLCMHSLGLLSRVSSNYYKVISSKSLPLRPGLLWQPLWVDHLWELNLEPMDLKGQDSIVRAGSWSPFLWRQQLPHLWTPLKFGRMNSPLGSYAATEFTGTGSSLMSTDAPSVFTVWMASCVWGESSACKRGAHLRKELLWLAHFLQCLGVCWIYYHGLYFHMSAGQWRWICAHVIYQIFTAVVTHVLKNLVLLFKQSCSDSQTRHEDSERDAGSDAKLVVSFNSFCRASFCWLESLHLKCNYPDAEKRQSPAIPEKGKFPHITPSPSAVAHFQSFPDTGGKPWSGQLCKCLATDIHWLQQSFGLSPLS